MAPQFDGPLRDLLRAAGSTMVRQGEGSQTLLSAVNRVDRA
jgi:hypothetical protein